VAILFERILTGVVAGAIATLVMDVLNLAAVRVGLALPVRHRTIGRVTGGWLAGRFANDGPEALPAFRGDLAWGVAAHYLIGGALGVVYVAACAAWLGGPGSLAWALGYGAATTVFAWFLMFPSLGLGVFGLASPHGVRLPVSSLVNHLLYGLGLAGALALLPA
jgi:hypothetical protein